MGRFSDLSMGLYLDLPDGDGKEVVANLRGDLCRSTHGALGPDQGDEAGVQEPLVDITRVNNDGKVERGADANPYAYVSGRTMSAVRSVSRRQTLGSRGARTGSRALSVARQRTRSRPASTGFLEG